MTNLLVTKSHITIKGEAGGQEIEITGDIKDMQWAVESDYDHVIGDDYPWSFSFKNNEKYTLEFKPDDKDGRYVTMKVKGVEVEKSARIRADANTVAGLERARKRAGAPKDAQVKMWGRTSVPELMSLDEVGPVDVEFHWKEVSYT